MADALVERLIATQFDDGLRLTEAEVIGVPDDSVLVVRFQDERRSPDGPQAAWWDFATCAEFLDDPDALASFAKAFLEELYWAGAPYEHRPQDDDGMTWGEMDSATVVNRLPPFLRP